ncbi:MAG: NAD-dependent epimerase/dehydratase family protein [bacterium]|nr:NAD-dependent epimerase/dehydratase family protein [bacterium]
MKALVTGATGCVGSGLAELLVSRGHGVRALVRRGSDTAFLRSLGAELREGDLADAASLAGAVEGIEVVFHCAAQVSDWAGLEEMRLVNVRGLELLLQASAAAGVRRFVYMSSMVVLGMGRQENLDESAPFVRTGDNYNTTKIKAERLLWSFSRSRGLPVTVIRAPYVYGPRDRQMFPRILAYLRNGRYAYVAGGRNPFTLVYAGNLAEGLRRAAEAPAAAGQVYNITDGAAVTRRELIERIADGFGLPRPRKNIPYPLAAAVCAVCELAAKLLRLRTPPILNRFRLKFMHTHLTFDISKARREIGYEPPVPFEAALRETIEWFKSHEGEGGA